MLSKNAGSYLTYGSTGGVAGAVNVNAPGPLDNISNAGTEMANKANDSAWLTKLFPELVEDGTLTLVNGNVFYDGISVVEMASLTVMGLSVFFIIVKGLSELYGTITKSKLNVKEATLLDKKIDIVDHASVNDIINEVSDTTEKPLTKE